MDNVTLTLSKEEARAVWAVLYNVNSCPEVWEKLDVPKDPEGERALLLAAAEKFYDVGFGPVEATP